jgi:hypothetical protein
VLRDPSPFRARCLHGQQQREPLDAGPGLHGRGRPAGQSRGRRWAACLKSS